MSVRCPACRTQLASALSSPAPLGAAETQGAAQNQVHFGQASAFPSVQCLHWMSLACAAQMTGGAYVCFYSSISKGWLQGGACTFPVCLAKKPALESTGEPYSPAEHAILMFTKDRVLSKPGEMSWKVPALFSCSWICLVLFLILSLHDRPAGLFLHCMGPSPVRCSGEMCLVWDGDSGLALLSPGSSEVAKV